MLRVFGNSHVITFCGSPPSGNISPKITVDKPVHNPSHRSIVSHFLGKGIIAYNFRWHHLPKVRQCLANHGGSKANDVLLFYVGEVDCRYHLAKRVLAGGDRVELVKECVERLWLAYDELLAEGWKIAVAGTHPTTTEGHDEHPDHPHWGDCAHRNAICVEWNKQLKEKCDSAGVPFICVYDKLVDENNITRMEYFVDYCHLNYERCFPMFLEQLEAHGLVKTKP